MVMHLTFEELLEFNAMDYTEARSGELAARVTAHVRDCKECRAALAAVQKTEAELAAARKPEAPTVRVKDCRREKLF